MDQLAGDQSRERAQREAFSEEMIGLSRMSEVSVDQLFDAHLKKISRDIHDHLRDYFGGYHDDDDADAVDKIFLFLLN